MIWWCHCSTHGEREGKPLEGRAAAAHVECCVLCGCVLCCADAFFVRRQQEGDKNKKVTDGAKQNWQAPGALRIFSFFLVYVDKYQFPDPDRLHRVCMVHSV